MSHPLASPRESSFPGVRQSTCPGTGTDHAALSGAHRPPGCGNWVLRSCTRAEVPCPNLYALQPTAISGSGPFSSAWSGWQNVCLKFNAYALWVRLLLFLITSCSSAGGGWDLLGRSRGQGVAVRWVDACQKGAGRGRVCVGLTCRLADYFRFGWKTALRKGFCRIVQADLGLGDGRRKQTYTSAPLALH